MKYYLIGIKGTGMSALALILHDLNYQVKGADFNTNFFTEEELLKRNIIIEDINQLSLDNNYTYIIGNSFIDKECFSKIKDNNLKYIFYPEFIEKHIKGHKIVVSGTHGKTTTTKLLAALFKNKNSNILIGDGTGIGNLNSNYFILEGCEYKDHFLNYTPEYLLITNIELDHIDYFKNIEMVYSSFIKLIEKSKKVIILDSEFKKLNIKKTDKIITFGKNADFNVKTIKTKTGYNLLINHNENIYEIKTNFFARYMINNFMLAFITAILENIDIKLIQEEVINFLPPKRRFQEYKINNNSIFIDDYAHHPTEIKETLKAIKNKYKKQIIAIFEPHTYSRYKFFYHDFIKELKKANSFYIEEIFSSNRERKTIDDITEENYKITSTILNSFKNMENTVFVLFSAGNKTSKYFKLFNI